MAGRLVGRRRGAPGPTMVVMTGVHGNEPAGVAAARAVLASCAERGVELAGELVVLAGNLAAIAERRRFIDVDLNRQWTPERLAALDAAGTAEAREQRELLELLRQIATAASDRPFYFIDLHTSSAVGPPFVTVGDTLRNRRFAEQLPLPLILGLEEQVDGALLEYLNNRGCTTLGVEAGQHDDPDSTRNHEAMLWLALVAAGLLRAGDVPDIAGQRARLERASAGVPPIVEVRRRHAIRPEDGFRMIPGFHNFQPVTRGQELAHDRTGPIHAPESGLILLPLYQGQGDDGFFIAREVRPGWLLVSALLRRVGMWRLLRWLPGVRRDRRRAGVLAVNTRIARLYPLEIFHLFGYRKLRRVGNVLLVSRRAFDLAAPQRIDLDQR